MGKVILPIMSPKQKLPDFWGPQHTCAPGMAEPSSFAHTAIQADPYQSPVCSTATGRALCMPEKACPPTNSSCRLTNYETVRDGKLDPRHFAATCLN